MTIATGATKSKRRALGAAAPWLLANLMNLVILREAQAEPPAEPYPAGDIEEHRREASQHAAQAREHAAEAMEQSREAMRAKLHGLREATREQREEVREGLDDARSAARSHFSEAQEQLRAAGSTAREQLKGARESLREGLIAGKAELKATGEMLSQEFAVLRERAEKTRASVWAQWRAKLRSPEAIDQRISREFEKHARREAKLQRIEAVARDKRDDAALDRVARLRAREADRHEQRMQKLTTDRRQAEPAR